MSNKTRLEALSRTATVARNAAEHAQKKYETTRAEVIRSLDPKYWAGDRVLINGRSVLIHRLTLNDECTEVQYVVAASDVNPWAGAQAKMYEKLTEDEIQGFADGRDQR